MPARCGRAASSSTSAFRPSDRFSVYANGAYTDAKYVKFVDAPCPPELSGGIRADRDEPAKPGRDAGAVSPANCDISGQRLPGVSKWAFSYGAEYDLPATIGGRRWPGLSRL